MIVQAGRRLSAGIERASDVSGPGKSRRGKPGRPPVSSEVRGLIRRMSRENPLWGAPRIHGELRMLGFEVSEGGRAQVHAAPSKAIFADMADVPREPRRVPSVDRLLRRTHRDVQSPIVLVVLRHERRRIVHIGTTAHPTAAWVAQHIREAFQWETAPRYMIRDRDRVYGIAFRSRIKAMGIERS